MKKEEAKKRLEHNIKKLYWERKKGENKNEL